MSALRLKITLMRACTLFLFTIVSMPAWSEINSERLSTITEEGMAMWNVPGMSVAVVTPQEVLFQQGFGETSINRGEKVDQHTLFAIASTTKAMVVTGLLMLVDEGKLSLDAPVAQYIPELRFSSPELTQRIMVRDLLAHRTGLPSTDLWSFFLDMPLEEQVQRLAVVEPQAPLRTRVIYQNTMFELAGLIIERITGTRWDVFLTERLWQPVGMNETYGARGQIPATQSHVMPHQYQDDEVSIVDWDLPVDLADAAGSAWSSIHDMSLWAQFLLRNGVTSEGKRLVAEDSMEQMFEPQQLSNKTDFYPTIELTQPNWRSYGLGWFQQDFQGRKIDFHTGSLSGLVAIIGLDHANDTAIVVLGNRDHAEMRHALLWEVMDHTPLDQRRDWNQDVFDLYHDSEQERESEWATLEAKRLPDTRPSLPSSAYEGTYSSPQNGAINVVLEENRLLIKTPLVTMDTQHWHVDTWLVTHKPWELKEFARFNITPGGAVQSFEFLGDTFHRMGEGSSVER